MIYVNTYSYENNKDKYRFSIEDLFKTTVMNEELDAREVELIKRIDNATVVGRNTVRNFMGDVTSVENLSRGLKTLLVIRWFIKNKKDLYFDVSSCGNNVFDSLVEEIGNRDAHLLLCNYTVWGDKEADITVNDKYSINSFSKLAGLGEKLYETCN